MQSPIALVLDDDRSIRERARDALRRGGIDAVAVATPREALARLRENPLAIVVAVVGDAPDPARRTLLEELCRLRANDGADASFPEILGRSQAAESLRARVHELAASRSPVLFSGEVGSGRRHAARCLHAASKAAGSFVVIRAGDGRALEAAASGESDTVFLPALEQLAWPEQEAVAAIVASPSIRARVVASIGVDPRRAVDEGRLSLALLAAFTGSSVAVPPLRERRMDIAVLVQKFIEELRVLNRLPPLAVAPDAMAALERFSWPGNVTQLRGAVESAVMLATESLVRLRDLPEIVRNDTTTAGPGLLSGGRFREAKRVVVDAFERSYLEDLLKRHGGNVTGAAEQSGMLRSALQRLLRKHELHSADFRHRGATTPYVT
jgi:DNA-binding NtrC family response regulator